MTTKRRRYGHHDHPDESELWLISYADMVTLLLGFFVILYSLSQVDDKKLSEIGKELSKAFGAKQTQQEQQSKVGSLTEAREIRALQMLIAMLNLGDNMEDGVTKIEQQVANSKNLEAAKKILAESVKNEQGVELLKTKTEAKDTLVDLVLPDRAMFAPGSDQLQPQSKANIRKVAQSLASMHDIVQVEINGHTDSTKPSAHAKFSNNWALSSARAGAVAEEFIKAGFDRKRIKTGGMADVKPLFPERSASGQLIPENMSKNRRVQIIVRMVKEQSSDGAH